MKPIHLLCTQTILFKKALNRAWIEFSSELIMSLVKISRAMTETELQDQQEEGKAKLKKLEDNIQHTPYFNGKNFSLIDAAFAPYFFRLAIIEQLYPMHLLTETPRVAAWSKHLLARPSVQQSVIANFSQAMQENIKARNGLLAQKI